MPDRFQRGVFLQSPLAGRPGLRTESAATNTLAKDLDPYWQELHDLPFQGQIIHWKRP